MLVVSVSMSLIFGFISQSLLTKAGSIFATCVILVFIFLAVLFDMVGVAVMSAEKENFLKLNQKQVKGAACALSLCENCEKVCSFCGDVVGDICSTLCGAGGTCIVVAITKHTASNSLLTLISMCVSALIAGLMVFFKALMKEYALKNSNKIILKLGILLENSILRDKNSK